MKTNKYQIYSYWKDKAITKCFEVKPWKACVPEDEAVKIVEFPDEIACWGCGMLPYTTADSEKLQVLWNQDHSTVRAHILAESKGGEDAPSNLFLLCPNCHGESPDTTNPENFYAWVYYKRKHENWAQVYRRELERAAAMKGLSYEEVLALFGRADIGLDLDKIREIREQMTERCALHGGEISMSSKFMAFIDILMERAKE